MKRLRLYAGIIFLVLAVMPVMSQERAQQIREKLLDRNLNSVIVVSHRADWRNFPENSLEAIQSAIDMGVDVVELDLQRTKDGVLILMHDDRLDRTTTGRGKVSDWTLDSIRTLRLKNGCNIKTIHKIPTLEEALILVKGKIMINLDKADVYFDQVYELLEKTGTTFKDKQQGDTRPIRYAGAIVVAVLMTALMAGIIALMAWAFAIEPKDAPPLPLLVVLMAIPAAVIACR